MPDKSDKCQFVPSCLSHNRRICRHLVAGSVERVDSCDRSLRVPPWDIQPNQHHSATCTRIRDSCRRTHVCSARDQQSSQHRRQLHSICVPHPRSRLAATLDAAVVSSRPRLDAMLYPTSICILRAFMRTNLTSSISPLVSNPFVELLFGHSCCSFISLLGVRAHPAHEHFFSFVQKKMISLIWTDD